MSDPKTQCADWGRPILQLTADRHGGCCVPCHRNAAAIPSPWAAIARKAVFGPSEIVICRACRSTLRNARTTSDGENPALR